MITIEQLLESVDLDFEPRFVTKDENGTIYIWADKPEIEETIWDAPLSIHGKGFGELKLSEFADKPWQECIYKVPRKDKPVVKIEKLNLLNDSALLWGKKINELVAAVNELMGEKHPISNP